MVAHRPLRLWQSKADYGSWREYTSSTFLTECCALDQNSCYMDDIVNMFRRIFLHIVWTATVLTSCVPPHSATTPVPSPAPPLVIPQDSEEWALFQPIDAEVREYLASSKSRSPEALDALARDLAKRYSENLELMREEIARTKEMPDLTTEEKELLNYITVREYIHMLILETRDKPQGTTIVVTPVEVTPPDP